MGMSVDELLKQANGNDIEFLFAIEGALQEKLDPRGTQALSQEERTVLAIEALEREVNNGGYSLFFVNSSSEFAPMVVDSLHRISCQVTAGITSRAIEALKPSATSDQAIREAVAAYAIKERARWQPKPGGVLMREEGAGDHETVFRELDECDQLYYSAGEYIGGQLIEFVKANKSAIRP
jgi:hypothetical protein